MWRSCAIECVAPSVRHASCASDATKRSLDAAFIGHEISSGTVAQRRRAARAQATRATNFTKEIRAIATHQYLTCVDLKNCYPIILTDMFPDIAELKYYVDHRDEVLAETMRHYGVSRDAAKQLYLRLSFKGTRSAWRSD